jgi:hypothetical protein
LFVPIPYCIRCACIQPVAPCKEFI